MPELPEVETVRKGLLPAMEGGRIVGLELKRPDLRFPFPAKLRDLLLGRVVVTISRRAKYLLFHLDDQQTLLAHLGMSGSFRVINQGAEATPGDFHITRGKLDSHDHVVMEIGSQTGQACRIIYNDPRRFGFMDLVPPGGLEENRFLKGLGVEPTGNLLSGEVLSSLFAGKQMPLKSALLDQRLIAGLGNIYVCEALWRAGLSPTRRAATISGTKMAEKLAADIRSVIAQAIEAGGSSLRDYVQTDGSLGYFQHSFSVYDQEGEACKRPGCTGLVGRIVQSGRSTFYCGTCQH